MSEAIERSVYGVLSEFIGAGIAMAVLFTTGGGHSTGFILLFMIPSFVLGLIVGKNFCNAVWQIFKAIW